MKTSHPWEKTYREKKFKITTQEPSVIVKKYKKLFKNGNHVLDIGSGNGRNSIFLASLGCLVDSFDIADLKWLKKLPKKLLKNIKFTHSNISKYKFKKNYYQTIIIARVIQYLTEKELIYLIDKVYTSLKNDGFILLSYNTSGGIFNQKEINVFKHSYTKSEIIKLFKQKFKKVVIYQGSTTNKHVNYHDKIKSYDIFISDKKLNLK